MKILQGIWATWGALVFIILMFLALPIYIIGIAIWGQKAIQKVHFVSRLWASGIFFLCGIIPKNVGTFKPDKKQSHVLISNHQSALDVPLCAIVTALPFRFLSKAELGKIPILGWIIKNIYLTVDRSSVESRKKSLDKMKRALHEGNSLFIYPEGTRNRSNEPTTRFFDGAFRLALVSKKPLAMLVILNANELCPAYGFRLKPGVLKYKWLETIDTKDWNEKEMDKLKSLAKQKINDALIEMKDGKKA